MKRTIKSLALGLTLSIGLSNVAFCGWFTPEVEKSFLEKSKDTLSNAGKYIKNSSPAIKACGIAFLAIAALATLGGFKYAKNKKDEKNSTTTTTNNTPNSIDLTKKDNNESFLNRLKNKVAGFGKLVFSPAVNGFNKIFKSKKAEQPTPAPQATTKTPTKEEPKQEISQNKKQDDKQTCSNGSCSLGGCKDGKCGNGKTNCTSCKNGGCNGGSCGNKAPVMTENPNQKTMTNLYAELKAKKTTKKK